MHNAKRECLTTSIFEKQNKESGKKGRRSLIESADAFGRYRRAKTPKGKTDFGNVAIDATLRTSALRQATQGTSLKQLSDAKQITTIIQDDLRQKRRYRRAGAAILFLVDASGSLGVKKQMQTVKGVILELLKDAYHKRDQVGMVIFRRMSAELVLPMTSHVTEAEAALASVPTGGKTPLAHGLVYAKDYLTQIAADSPGMALYLVVVSDGKANVPLAEGGSAQDDVRQIATGLAQMPVERIVLDTEQGRTRFACAKELASALEATYHHIDDIRQRRALDHISAS